MTKVLKIGSVALHVIAWWLLAASAYAAYLGEIDWATIGLVGAVAFMTRSDCIKLEIEIDTLKGEGKDQ